MNETSQRFRRRLVDRRQFLAVGAVATLGGLTPGLAKAGSLCANLSDGSAGDLNCQSSSAALLTGNGEWTYRVVPGWGSLPLGASFGGTHGGIVQDKTGNIYVSTQSATGVLVYSSEGALLRTIATQYPEVHSMFYSQQDGDEYIYATVQKGTSEENWLFVKIKTDGTVVQKIKAPPEAGFKAANEWRLTAAVRTPDGDIFIANGYGDSRIFHFDKLGQYKMAYSGKGTSDGLLNCSHGLAVDTRYEQPLLLVCDRENRRLCHFDFDGRFVRTVSQHLRRPCQVSFNGDYAFVSELEGRLTILDRDNVPVAFLGDNPQRAQWANYDLKPPEVPAATFSAAHGCFVDRDANVYVSDWNRTGRVTKLARVQA